MHHTDNTSAHTDIRTEDSGRAQHQETRPNSPGGQGVHVVCAALALFLGVALVIVDGTIVNVALPVLTRELGVDEGTSTWLVTAYQMGLLALLFPAMAFSTFLGARTLFLAGSCLFVLASLGCSLSQHFATLLCFRILQSVGGAAMLSVNISLVEHIFTEARLRHGIGLNTATISLSIILGPPLAALILTHASWHWLFAFNVPLGLAVVATGIRFLPRTRQHRTHLQHLPSLLETLVLSLLLFTAFFGLIGTLAYDLPVQIAPAAAILLLLTGRRLHRQQQKTPFPLFPRDLYSHKPFVLSLACSFFAFCAQAGAVLAMPFFFMGHLGFSITQTSFLLLCWPALHICASLSSGHLLGRMTPSLPCFAGILVCATGLVLLACAQAPAQLPHMALLVALCGLGYGLFQAPNETIGLLWAPRERRLHTSAALAFVRTFGQTMGSLATAAALVWFPDSSRLPFILTTCFALIAAGCISLRYTRFRDPEQAS